MGNRTTSYWNDWVTPNLSSNPSLASDVQKSGAPNAYAPLVSHVSNTVNAQNAINDHSEENGTSSFWSKIINPAITGLEYLGKPLKEIQRDYKFIHAVYTDHGFLPGFLMTAGVIAGTAGGAVLGGPLGAAIGADIAGTLIRKAAGTGPWKSTFSDSYRKSEDENYIVSPGRDFSNAVSDAFKAVGWDDASKAFKTDFTNKKKNYAAGGVDLAFDIVTDPLMIIGRFGQLMRTGKLLGLDKAGEVQLKYPIMDTVPGVKQFVFERSRVPVTSEQLDAVRAGHSIFNSSARVYNRALDDIAKSTAGEIALKYPQLGTAAAGRLGALDTADKVHEFFKTSLYFGELEGTLAGHAMLPTRTFLRARYGDSTVAMVLRNAAVPKYVFDAAGNRIKNPKYSAISPKQRLSRIYQTFSGYMPYSVDKETGKLSLTKFRWDANDSASVIYRIARFGMGDNAGKEMAGKYAEAVAVGDKALARSIKNQTLLETFKALGLPNDNKLVTKVWEDINKIDDQLVSSQVYGTDFLGQPLGEYMTSSGLRVGGLWSHQATDMFDIPDFYAIKKAMRESGRFTKYAGKMDDFIANAYTNRYFKPLALATAGFGLRIAASELIPTFARYGITNTFKAKLGASAAKANYDLIDQEKPHLFAAVMSALGIKYGIDPNTIRNSYPAFQEAARRGLNFAAKLTASEQMELAQRIMMTNSGHIISEATSTGHGYDAATAYGARNAAHYTYQIHKNNLMFKDSGEYTTYESSSTYYAPTLHTNIGKLSKENGARNISQDLLAIRGKYINLNKFQIEDDVTKLASYNKFQDMRQSLIDLEYKRLVDSLTGKYKGYDKEIQNLTRMKSAANDGDLKTFAQDRVDAVLGTVIGKDGTFHPEWANAIAKGEELDYNTLLDKVNTFPRSMPAAVAGPVLEPYIGQKGMLNNIVNFGFKKVIDPIVNNLAREPLYMMHVADAYARMIPRIKSGLLLEDQALRIAQTQATFSMLPQIHNTALRNQFSQLARNFLPFYFAQEQALKRAFATLKDTSVASPAFSRGLRFYQLAEHAINDPGFVTTDDQGNRYVNLPGVGAFGEMVQAGLATYGIPMVTGLPISAKGSLISLKTVLPELQMPGASPIFAISANIVSDWFPQLQPVVKGAIGDISYQRGVLDTLMPATWFKTAVAAGTSMIPGGGIDLTGQMANATASALAAAYYHDQVPGPDSGPFERQAFIDRIKNNARSILILKTFLNLTSPLAPQVKQEDAGFREEFWKLVKEKGNMNDALIEFLGKHGNRAISYTVARTESNVPGAKYPYIQDTVDFIKNNPQLFSADSGVATGAMFLIPQESVKTQSDINIFNELMSMHLRSRKTPEDMLKSFYVAQGSQMMADEIKKHVDILNQAETNYDSFSKQQENTRWSAIMKKMENLYPIWYADYTDNEGRIMAKTAYNQLVKIFSGPNPPNHEQARLVRALMQDYEAHNAVMTQYKMVNISGPVSKMESQKWENYLMRLKEADPRLSSIISTVFLKLG